MPCRLLFVLTMLTPFILSAQRMNESWYRALAAFERGEFGLAQQWVDSGLMSKPANAEYNILKGRILYSKGEYSNALSCFEVAEKTRKDAAKLWLAKTSCMLGDTASGLKWLRLHLESANRTKESTIKLDPAFTVLSKTRQWDYLWRKEWYNPFERLVAEVEYNIEKRNWDEALELLNRKIKDKQSRHVLLALRGEVYYQMGSYKAAAEDLTLAVKKSKKNHEYMALLARVYNARRQYLQSASLLNRAIELSGGNPKYLTLRAIAYSGSNQFAKAYDDVRAYLSYYPSDQEASYLLAKCAYQLGLYVDALLQLGRLIKANPQNPEYYYYRGVTFLKTQQYPSAQADLDIAINLGYNLAETFYYRAMVHLMQNRPADACVDWEKARQNGSFAAQEMLYLHCKKNARQPF